MLISNWRDAWKFLSVQFAGLGAAIAAAWVMLTDKQKEDILTLVGINAPAWVTLATFVAVVLGRMIAQPAVSSGGGNVNP